MAYTVLILDSDTHRTQQMMEWLIPTRTYLIAVSNANDALKQVKAQAVDIVFVSSELPDASLEDFLSRLLQEAPIVQIIVMLSREEFFRGQELQQLQISGFILTPFKQDELLFRVFQLTEVQRLKRENQYLREELQFDDMRRRQGLPLERSPRGKRRRIRLWN